MVEIKAKYFLLEPKCGAWRQNGGRLGDFTEAGRPVFAGPGGNSANPEVRRSFLRGSWLPPTTNQGHSRAI